MIINILKLFKQIEEKDIIKRKKTFHNSSWKINQFNKKQKIPQNNPKLLKNNKPVNPNNHVSHNKHSKQVQNKQKVKKNNEIIHQEVVPNLKKY